ncbi:MAG: Ig-like domain-containing protein [Desulfobacula sp.]
MTSGTIGGFTLGALARTNATTYTATFTIAEFGADVAAGVDIDVNNLILTDTAGNTSVAYGTDISQAADPIDANSPIIGSVAVSPDGLTAKIGDAITATITAAGAQADLSLVGVCTINTVDVFGSFVNNADGTYTLTYNVNEGDDDVASNTLAISCALQEPSLNTVTASSFDANTLVIDANTPTLSNITYSSDNADSTLAKAGDTIYLEFQASETLSSTPPPTVTFASGGVGVANVVLVGDGDGTCGDAGPANDVWTACYTVDPTDTDGLVTFTIDYADVALNAGLQETAVDDASTVDVDVTAPGFAPVNPVLALLQDGTTSPTVPVAMWYYYQGVSQWMEFTVESDEALSAAYVCTESVENDDPITGLCADEPAFLANSIMTTDNTLGGNLYRFEIDIDNDFGGYPTQVSGYAMNFKLVDAAGNIGYSAGPQHAFTGVWNVNPYDFTGLDNVGTTDWSQDIPDFTNVTNLSFTMNMGAGDLGSLVLDGPIDLTDNSVISNLSALGTSLLIGGGDGSGDAVLGMDASALTALNTSATMTALVPGSRPGIVLYADDGTTVIGYVPSSTGDGVTINDVGGSGDDITFTSFVGNVITFSTTGFSQFGTDNTAPTVTTFSPLDNATGVAIATNLVLTFDENVQVGTGNVVIKKSADDSIVETIDITGGLVTFNGTTGVTINPTASLLNNTGYYVQIANTSILDMVGNAYAGIADTTTWNFTTIALPSSGGGSNLPVDTNLPVATSISIAGGAVQTSSQSVTLALSATNAAQMMISNTPDFTGAVWETYATNKAWTLTQNYETKTVYAKFKNAAGSVSSVISDTIAYVQVVTIIETPIEDANLITQDPAPAPALPPQVTIGSLVKRADMTSVYFIDQDNRRHAFPNSAVFLSYYPDFSGVQTITAATMSEIPLGNNVTMRPGTYLVKIQSDPKVYAVAPYGVLKWITTEQLAVSLYGSDWATRIIDVEPTFFSNYQTGSSITTAIHPTGSAFSYLGDSKVYYVEGGNKRYVSPDVFISNKFQNKFISRNISTSIAYPDGADLPSQGMEVIMTLR